MKKLLISAILCLMAAVFAKGQTVYSCKYKSDADVKVYVSQYKSKEHLMN